MQQLITDQASAQLLIPFGDLELASVLSGTMTDLDGEIPNAAQIDDEGDPESEKKEDPEGETERDRALRRMDRRRDALIRGNPVLGGLSPLFAGE